MLDYQPILFKVLMNINLLNQSNLILLLIMKVLYKSILGAAVVTIIFLIIELVILFIGMNLFYDKNNLFRINKFKFKNKKIILKECLMHGLGTILYSWFVLDKWHYKSLWYLWGIFRYYIVICHVKLSFL